jgi:hypothetical protein
LGSFLHIFLWGIETVCDGVLCGYLASLCGRGAMRFRALGTGGIDFSLRGHSCTFFSVGPRFPMNGGGSGIGWEMLEK